MCDCRRQSDPTVVKKLVMSRSKELLETFLKTKEYRKETECQIIKDNEVSKNSV